MVVDLVAAALRGGGDMKRTVHLTEADRELIKKSVAALEARSSSEVVPMIISASSDYPAAVTAGGFGIALFVGTLVSHLWFADDLTTCIIALALALFPARWVVRRLPLLLRVLIHNDEMDAEVTEQAKVAFVDHGLHATRDHSGILILISLFEHRVHILADRGISSVVEQRVWDDAVGKIVQGIHEGRLAEALASVIDGFADLLADKVPRRDDDTNELPDLII